MYVSFEDLNIYKLDYICTCDECKERGYPELFFKTLDGHYADVVASNELPKIIEFSESLDEVIDSTMCFFKREIYKQKRNNDFLQHVINNCIK